MNQFMVTFDLPEFTTDFIQKIPAQRATINKLLEQGKIQSYAVSADRVRMWCIVNATSELEVFDIIAEFPLRDYLSPQISELMFNNAVIMKIPIFSLN